MGIAEVLVIVFAIMKCLGHIDWSWFWVFSPMIFLYGSLICVGMIAVIIGVSARTYLNRKRSRDFRSGKIGTWK